MELKPCPFCGGKACTYSETTYPLDSGHEWICFCKTCDAQGEIGETEEEAVRNWNRRTVDVDALEDIAEELDARFYVVDDGQGLTDYADEIIARIRKAVGV